MADAVLGQRRGSVNVTAALGEKAEECVRNLRRELDAQMYTREPVDEAWLEIAHADPDSGELSVLKSGKKHRKLVRRVHALGADDSPRFFVGVTRTSPKSTFFRTFVLRWVGLENGGFNLRRLAYGLAFQSIQRQLAEIMSADLVLDDVTDATDLSRKALARLQGRQRRIDGSAVSTMGRLNVELNEQDFIARNQDLADTFNLIRQDMSSENLTWMIIGYHHPRSRRRGSTLTQQQQQQQLLMRQQEASDEDDEDDRDEDLSEDDDLEDGDNGSYGPDSGYSSQSAASAPLALPVLIASGGGGIEAFDPESGGILNTINFRPGWLYWIYARVEVDAIEGTGRFRAGSHANGQESGRSRARSDSATGEGNTMAPVAGGCKFLLITFHEGEAKPAMSLRLNEHHKLISDLFKHHVHLEATSLADLTEESVAHRLLATTDGNRIVLTVNVGSGSGSTLRRMEDNESMSAPLLIRISPHAPLSELKRRIAKSYKCSPDSVLIMRVTRKANRDVISALISSTAHARSESDLDEAFRKASSNVEVNPLEGDAETLTDMGLVSGEELYVKLIKEGSKRDSRRAVKRMGEIPLVDRRRVAVQQFLQMRQQRSRMPLFTSMRDMGFASDDEDEDDDDEEEDEEVDTFDTEEDLGVGDGDSDMLDATAELKKVSSPTESNVATGNGSDKATLEDKSNKNLERLRKKAEQIGASFIDDEDLVVMENAVLGDGRTARVLKGVLLCKLDRMNPITQVGRKNSRAMSSSNWAQFRKESTMARAEDTSALMDAAAGLSLDDQDGEYLAVPVAVKRFTAKRVTDEVYTAFLEEITVLGRLQHECIVQILGVYIDTTTRREEGDENRPLLMICYEYMPRGSLASLRKTDLWLDVQYPYKILMARNVARGLRYLHEECVPPVAHRDLKSDNLLVDEDISIKIGDFGNSTDIKGPLTGKMGTAGWTAPEILENGAYDKRCDIFSFGVILWEFVTSEPNPLWGVPEDRYLSALRNKTSVFELPADMDPVYANLVKDCMSYDPEDRPTASEIVETLECALQRAYNSS
ncbi:Protein kinase, putative [Hondaea fermentalgiana]|uniref:Protein kinase, putative n=1 Tax=Hondaea fermentalgiana TaxID=2315210 RepID=A0A2R5GXT1_9STRA|nr:Protein kinase, putative [Hondaea fermentalgiana]|eukprot:GBG33513.1 Protein kinase, putative [Hondaea fermentalgiana]